MRKTASLLVVLTPLALVWAAPSVKLRMEVSPKDVYIGDVIEARIFVTSGNDVTLMPLEVLKTLGNFEVRTWSPKPVQQIKPDQKLSEIDFELVTFSTGPQSIPSLTLKFRSTDGNEAQALTEPVQINVKSLLQEKGDEGRLRPPKGTIDFRSWRWLLIVLVILIVAGLGYWLWRRHARAQELLHPQGPPKKPEELAWESLNALEDSTLIAEGKIKEFYSRLSDILRTYIEGRFQLSALERTTSELLVDLRTLSLTSELTTAVRYFLEGGDLVKFAKVTPQPDEIHIDLLRVKQFISQTTVKETPKEEGTPAPEKEISL